MQSRDIWATYVMERGLREVCLAVCAVEMGLTYPYVYITGPMLPYMIKIGYRSIDLNDHVS